MRLTVNSNDLKTAATMAARVMNAKNSMPILDCIRFETDGNALTVRATDNQCAVITQAAIMEKDGDGVFCVDAKKLTDGLKNIPEQPITLEAGNGLVMCKYGNGKFSMPTDKAEDFPDLPKLAEEKDVMAIPSANLLDAISRVINCTANDEIHPAFNGICLDMKENVLNVVATDGHKLGIVKPSGVAAKRDCMTVIPKKAASILKSCISPKSEGQTDITFDRNTILFECGDFTLYTRRIEGRYPNYNSVIPKNNPVKVEIDRQLLINALKRVTAFASGTSGLAVLSFGRLGGLDVRCQDVDFSLSANEHVPCNSVSGDIKIGFKGEFLMQQLESMSGCVNIVISLMGASRAGVFTPPENEKSVNQLALLMPLMIQED